MRTRESQIAKKLKELGVMVFDPSPRLPPEYIRVSIGTKEENDVFLSALKEVLEPRGG